MYSQFHPTVTGSITHLAVQTLPAVFPAQPDYAIVAQNAIEVQNAQNAPSVSMKAFLMAWGERYSYPVISVYQRDGYDRKHARLLYMNATALRIWKIMGMCPRQIGAQHRPPHSAVLSFGMPFGA